MSTGELAKTLGLSRSSIARYAVDGRLTPALITPGGQYRWDLDDVKDQFRKLAQDRRNDQP
ncbi:helix-turn-helix domain-containing protein [Saccharopolyspora erythraea]|nr:helix-turn-helix domain-containing protein [Saccharopolyspora erythraea]